MRRNYILSFVFAVAASVSAAVAQNLDPTVEVSRAYEGKLMEVSKPVRDVNVPDSVGTFRLDFDYSVFENPYRGAYEFSPYLMDMRPSSSVYEPRSFYLKAGAGYRLYPELDLIWSPSFKNGFSMDVYAMHKSYVGDYRKIALDGDLPGTGNLVRAGRETWKGFDLMSKAGVNGRYGWSAGTFDFNVNYYGLAGKNNERTRCYDALDASLAVMSNTDIETSFIYGAELRYRFAEDKYRSASDLYLVENLAGVDAFVGPVFKNGHKVVFDFGGEMASYRSFRNFTAGKFYVTPHYVLRKGRWFVDAGVRVDMVLTSSRNPGNMFSAGSQQYAYPDVKISFAAIRDAMNIYTAVTGGTKMNTYASVLAEDHYADMTHDHVIGTDVERVCAELGLKGRISRRFSYDLRGGYSIYAAAALPSLAVIGTELHPEFGYASFQKAYAALDWRWDTDGFKFDGSVTYTHTWGFDAAEMVFAPAALTGNVAFEYNWKRRIFVGADCDFSTARKMTLLDVALPGYADLGVSVEYALNRKISFWLRGGNLCCMTIQRTPLYAEGGISATAGICLNL